MGENYQIMFCGGNIGNVRQESTRREGDKQMEANFSNHFEAARDASAANDSAFYNTVKKPWKFTALFLANNVRDEACEVYF